MIEIDEEALREARRQLGTHTLKDTVNLALRRAGRRCRIDVGRKLDVLAGADLTPRVQAWR